ncbi:hypothetical protein LTR37_012351 [Vermiconidia calcicola]|uniref:Uncharacterized protein n=1 Tax=Vermiconidia calcicola TaxID=1690605 RepID=A0ACC3N142_9PEZI|nr:hypothetical protein LTR37_012351 [Vermiconidia calcicola]
MADDTAQPQSKIPCLLDLCTDILVLIVELLETSDARSLSLVNSSLHKLAKYSCHRHLKLDLSEHGFEDTRKHFEIMDGDELLPAVHSLEIYGPGYGYPTGDFCTTLVEHNERYKNRVPREDRVAFLCRHLPSMTGLRHIQWHGRDLPDAALETLRQFPSVTLCVCVKPPRGPLESKESDLLHRLQDNPNLYRLEVLYTYKSAKDCLAVTQPLKDVLLSCPNIRKLRLDLGMPTGGCIIYAPTTKYCGLGFRNGQRPAALEELDIVRYPFGVRMESSSSLGHCYHEGYEEEGMEEDYWAEFFDWSRLRKLKSPSAKFALTLMPKLTALKEIAFYSGWDKDNAVQFYFGVPAALEAISVESIKSVTVLGVLRHGPSLRSLRIHQSENRCLEWHKDAIDNNCLRRIQNGCPNIEELALDLNRYKSWPYTSLDVLASFPRLHTLTIWFELGIHDRNKPIEPYVTFSAVGMLFKYLHARNSKVKTLIVHSGSPPGPSFGLPSPEAFWPRYNSSVFECKLSDRDDQAAQGMFKTTCYGLSKQGNEWLQARQNPFETVADGEREIAKFYEDSWDISLNLEPMRVALMGHTPLNRWKAHY